MIMATVRVNREKQEEKTNKEGYSKATSYILNIVSKLA